MLNWCGDSCAIVVKFGGVNGRFGVGGSEAREVVDMMR